MPFRPEQDRWILKIIFRIAAPQVTKKSCSMFFFLYIRLTFLLGHHSKYIRSFLIETAFLVFFKCIRFLHARTSKKERFESSRRRLLEYAYMVYEERCRNGSLRTWSEGKLFKRAVRTHVESRLHAWKVSYIWYTYLIIKRKQKFIISNGALPPA